MVTYPNERALGTYHDSDIGYGTQENAECSPDLP